MKLTINLIQNTGTILTSGELVGPKDGSSPGAVISELVSLLCDCNKELVTHEIQRKASHEIPLAGKMDYLRM